MRRLLVTVVIAFAAISCATDTDEPEATTAASPETDDMQAATPEATGPEGDVTEDGRHAVYIHDVDTAESTITVDALEWLTGDEAADAYYEETGERGGPPNDYFIKNDAEEEQALEVSEDAEITVTGLGGDSVDPDPVSFEELAEYLGEEGGDSRPFWIEVADEVVTKIEEQYVP